MNPAIWVYIFAGNLDILVKRTLSLVGFKTHVIKAGSNLGKEALETGESFTGHDSVFEHFNSDPAFIGIVCEPQPLQYLVVESHSRYILPWEKIVDSL
ncbi:hypothetical protein WICPIJ_007175 [Wickerhamomyces pijperi]|uniref:Uncharacterized protein n=1 Tax=Wickerhamomyces pijperi TaxID=599730 RepID=A0A9P8Q333_WICPI|nr:hypothetical protein WICPIJ_007175 [Wickerhamomyces pijperi]